jgi:hypothetical protein
MRNNSSAAVRLELEGELFANVEAWRREQEKIPSRSSAVRQLIERALIRKLCWVRAAGEGAPAMMPQLQCFWRKQLILRRGALEIAADTLLILKRHSGNVTLFAKGRDIEESETAVQFNKDTAGGRFSARLPRCTAPPSGKRYSPSSKTLRAMVFPFPKSWWLLKAATETPPTFCCTR